MKMISPPDIPRLDCPLEEIVLSVMEVKNLIKNLNKNKATGPAHFTIDY